MRAPRSFSLPVLLSLVIAHAQAPMRCMHPTPSEAKCAPMRCPAPPHAPHAEREATHAPMRCPVEKDRCRPRLTTTTRPAFFSWSSRACGGWSVRMDGRPQLSITVYASSVWI